MERTLVLVKPDGVQRGLIGSVISRFETKGLKLIGLKLLHMSKEMAEKHYEVHKDKPFYNDLVEYITSGPVVAMVVEGPSAISVVRNIMGPTNGSQAPPGSIRGDYSVSIEKNIVHGSDSMESADREIPIFFNNSEIVEYSKINEGWL